MMPRRSFIRRCMVRGFCHWQSLRQTLPLSDSAGTPLVAIRSGLAWVVPAPSTSVRRRLPRTSLVEFYQGVLDSGLVVAQLVGLLERGLGILIAVHLAQGLSAGEVVVGCLPLLGRN